MGNSSEFTRVVRYQSQAEAASKILQLHEDWFSGLGGFLEYTLHMKRTNLVLDPHLLEEAIRVFGTKTFSAAVNAALKEVLRVRHIQSLPQFFGSDLWEGNLAEMREDRTQKARPLKRRSPR